MVDGEEPGFLNFTTFAVAEDKVRVARNKSIFCHPVALDAEGKTTADPKRLYDDPATWMQIVDGGLKVEIEDGTLEGVVN